MLKPGGTKGQALVEIALLLPLYVLLFWTLLWFHDFGATRLAAEEGARWAAFQKKGWRGDGPATRRMTAHENVRDARLSCQAYKGKEGELKGVPGQIGGVFSSVMETREGRADLRLAPLPDPYPGRRDSVKAQATFVVDPVVPATSWFSRAMKMFGMKNPPNPPQVK